MWKAGTRLTHDPTGVPIKASDVTLGSAFHVIPEGLLQREDALEQKAKAAVLLMRLDPKDLHVSPSKVTWNYHGIVAYSQICTHVGCPVALYEQLFAHCRGIYFRHLDQFGNPVVFEAPLECLQQIGFDAIA